MGPTPRRDHDFSDSAHYSPLQEITGYSHLITTPSVHISITAPVPGCYASTVKCLQVLQYRFGICRGNLRVYKNSRKVITSKVRV